MNPLPRHSWFGVTLRLAAVGAAWGVTSVLFYRIESWLGTDNGYNDAPVLFALFYALAALVMVILFRQSYLAWAERELPPADYWPGLVMALVFAVFAIFILGTLPDIDWLGEEPLPDLLAATPWYFLPKSVEILFQQVLITTLIVGFYHIGLPLRATALITALAFGLVHLSLAWAGKDAFYVARYTVAATIFGFIAPFLQSRWRNGFAMSYGLHWSFYATDVTIAHFVG